MVLLYHAAPHLVPGGFAGVDVFFVISGFLITGMLMREVEQTGTVSLARFYARRAKRLLPAAALVLAVTAVFTGLVMSVVDRRAFGGDIVAAALYFVNWRFADRSVDYLAEDVGTSPVQHFWSLAVEEQFYIIWPLLVLVVAWWVRRNGEPVRPWMGVALCTVAIPSFVWSLVMTTNDPSAAFFVTTTRLWELALGAGIAVAMPLLSRLPRAVGALIAWGGLSAVILSAFVITSGTAWPGYAALLPVLGSAAVIAGGTTATAGGPRVVLASPLFVWVGGLSYSLYLWHWPMLVLSTAYWGELSTLSGLVIVATSFVPAWLAFRLVENPARHAGPLVRSSKFALSVGANLTFVGVLAGLVLVLSTPSSSAPSDAERNAEGAAVLGDDPRGDPAGEPVNEVEWMTPDPVDAPDDHPAAYDDGCQTNIDASEPAVCEYGDPEGDVTVALVGDSKALQWITAFDDIGQDNGWRVVTYTKSACAFADGVSTVDGEVYSSCAEWTSAVHDELLGDPPDVVVTSQARKKVLTDPDDADSGLSKDHMVDGLVEYWDDLSDSGVEVVALADTPQPGTDVYECVAENLGGLNECAFDRDEALDASAHGELREAVDQFDDASWIDLNGAICPADECAPVIGNVLVYRQGSHLTVTYIDSLKPRLASALEEIIE